MVLNQIDILPMSYGSCPHCSTPNQTQYFHLYEAVLVVIYQIKEKDMCRLYRIIRMNGFHPHTDTHTYITLPQSTPGLTKSEVWIRCRDLGPCSTLILTCISNNLITSGQPKQISIYLWSDSMLCFRWRKAGGWGAVHIDYIILPLHLFFMQKCPVNSILSLYPGCMLISGENRKPKNPVFFTTSSSSTFCLERQRSTCVFASWCSGKYVHCCNGMNSIL